MPPMHVAGDTGCDPLLPGKMYRCELAVSTMRSEMDEVRPEAGVLGETETQQRRRCRSQSNYAVQRHPIELANFR